MSADGRLSPPWFLATSLLFCTLLIPTITYASLPFAQEVLPGASLYVNERTDLVLGSDGLPHVVYVDAARALALAPSAVAA